ncbi:hypothetical protein AMTR_s00002p00049830 [Amborella trichopoda]|uniref:Uncharacterized protein n=1 Tax=Amborella trichopoda TaxID=13333 RepID=W1NZY6_AMBTC|nr:hypothetical protein AMTR_s00002p00049830 [Amborella trichopoda]
MEEGEQQDGDCGCLVVGCGVGEMKVAEVVESGEEQGRGRLLMIGSNRVIEVEQKWKGGSRCMGTRGTGKEEDLVAMVKEEEMAATQVVIAGNGS